MASSSPSRRKILNSSGIKFSAKAPDVDEDSLKKKFKGTPKKLALMLAEKKALSLFSKHSSALIVGADQVLSFKGSAFNKPKSLKEAKKTLNFLGVKHINLSQQQQLPLKGK